MRNITSLLIGFGCSAALLSSSLMAQAIEVAAPESVGMSSSALQLATDRLQRHIDEGDIAGVSAAVLRRGKLVYFESLGLMDIELHKPMSDDALFRQYSMARQITSAATLMLYEDGHFQLDDPISKFLPEFETQAVLIDASNGDINQTKQRISDITVANLLTHTSGLGSRSSAMYRAENVRDRSISLEQMVSNAARVPLFEQPGTRFRYGISATILGRLIEVWSGLSLEEFLQSRLYGPTGMTDTLFWANSEQAERLAQLYRPTDGKLIPYQIETIPFTQNPTLREGGVGLLSTMADYLRFSQMILNRGELNGRRVMAADTVELMFANAIPDSVLPIGSRGYMAGSGWTLGGFNIAMDISQYDHPVSEGTIWWDGSAGTRYWIDDQQEMVIVIMAQISPSRGNSFRENFKRLVDGAITERQ
ncbi:MAG: hypothetical protein COC19_02280 [SAR86 cluster bacterium]|uniref:Beta-lactamase-related domain-containing protein n=1 Tax=SAR86 cluster bacterium TaxID=2030880 RepID=A0A2A4MRL4_9GAMM|nr:MAG: hypothetical protein COC19_02280 [SAR86 cluster bacterium]